MAFIVENGTGVLDANAYISLTYANEYHAERGNAGWTGIDAVKQQAIVKATDYIETRWMPRVRGLLEFPLTPQGLAFPRLGLYDRYGRVVSGLPGNLQRATAEYALRALTQALMPDAERPPSGTSGPVTALRDRVGPVETETRYAFGLVTPEMIAIPAADRLMRMLLGVPDRSVYR